MRITHLTIENFRSIRKLELKDIPDVAVFYGENGTGKSNILRAVELAWECVAAAAGGQTVAARADAPLGTTLTPRLRIEVEFGSDAFLAGGWRTRTLLLECQVRDAGTLTVWPLTATLVDKSGAARDFTRHDQRAVFVEMETVIGSRAAVVVYEEWLSALKATLSNRMVRIADPRERGAQAGADGTVPALAAAGEIERRPPSRTVVLRSARWTSTTCPCREKLCLS